MSDIKKCKIRNWKEQSRDRGIWRKSIVEAKAALGCSANEEEEISQKRDQQVKSCVRRGGIVTESLFCTE